MLVGHVTKEGALAGPRVMEQMVDTVLALPIAMWVAYRRGSLTDRVIMVVTTVALSISFLVYVIVGQYVFAFQLGWFPVQGWSDSVLKNLVTYAPLPPLALCKPAWYSRARASSPSLLVAGAASRPRLN